LHFLIIGNTLYCWPENELHGTTVLPKEGVTCGLSQNLAKKTVSAVKKWREGSEQEKHKEYRLNQLDQDPFAKEALIESIKKNKEIKTVNSNYIGEYLEMVETDREWAE
jgi:hypothetical protein